MIFTFINTAISTHQDKHPRHVHVINIIPDKKGKLFNFKKLSFLLFQHSILKHGSRKCKQKNTSSYDHFLYMKLQNELQA